MSDMESDLSQPEEVKALPDIESPVKQKYQRRATLLIQEVLQEFPELKSPTNSALPIEEKSVSGENDSKSNEQGEEEKKLESNLVSSVDSYDYNSIKAVKPIAVPIVPKIQDAKKVSKGSKWAKAGGSSKPNTAFKQTPKISRNSSLRASSVESKESNKNTTSKKEE